jgi:hypothetical protein
MLSSVWTARHPAMAGEAAVEPARSSTRINLSSRISVLSRIEDSHVANGRAQRPR